MVVASSQFVVYFTYYKTGEGVDYNAYNCIFYKSFHIIIIHNCRMIASDNLCIYVIYFNLCNYYNYAAIISALHMVYNYRVFKSVKLCNYGKLQ